MPVSHELLGLIALAMTLLGTVLVSTWRFSALSSKLLSGLEQQKDDAAEVKEKLQMLDRIPTLETRIGYLEKNHSLIPKLESRLVAVEQAAKFSKELRMTRRGSIPDIEDDET